MSAAVDEKLWRDFGDDLDPAGVQWSERLPGGSHWSWRLRRGTALRLVALGDRANCSIILYSAENLLERYSMPDSLKAQHTARYTAGHVLMSDMGRAMASFIADQVGWHDAFGALLDTVALEQRYGVKRYELHRNQMHRSGRDGLLVEIAKYGLTARDLMTPVNLFTRLRTDEQGRFCFDPIADIAGRSVDLRCDMDLIVAVSSAPHPLDDAPAWAPAAIGVAAYQVGPAKQDDWCRLSSPEAERAHYNTDQFVWSAK